MLDPVCCVGGALGGEKEGSANDESSLKTGEVR